MDSSRSSLATADDEVADVAAATAEGRIAWEPPAAGCTVASGTHRPHLRVEPPAPDPLPAPLDPTTTDPRRYPITSEHARGGLGRILEAFDQRLGRVVAIKELVDGSRASSARFIREGLITARLEHPNIVPVHEVGRWPSGEPFYVMKFVSGRALDAIIAAAPTLDQRLALLPRVIAVADALAYAHSHRIIHRDLKPANVMIGAFGETVVIDWGLAKDLRVPEEHDAGPVPVPVPSELATRAGVVVGTPAYMPPEQARSEAVDERADVYALGALLYHLLVGRAPYTPGHAETVLAQVLAGPPQAVELEQPGVPPELAAVVRKAMAREPAARYPTARELAVDLRRFQEGRLVSAHHYTRVALVGRWLRRHRLPVVVAALALVALAALGVTSTRRVVAERNRAEARLHALLLTQASAALQRDPTEALAWLKTYPEAGAGWAAARRLGIEADRRGVARHVLGPNGFWGFIDDDRHWIGRQSDGQHQAFVLRDRETGRVTRSSPLPIAQIPLVVSPSGRFVAVRSADGRRFGLHDLVRGAFIVLGASSGRLACAFSNDNRWVALGSTDGSVRLWSIADAGIATAVAAGSGRTETLVARHDGPVEVVAFSADSRWLLTLADEPALVRLWEVGGAARHRLAGTRAPGFSYSLTADAAQLGFSNGDQDVWLWSAASDTRRRLGSTASRITHLSLAADGQTLATGEENGSVTLWSPAAGAARPLLPYHGAAIAAVAFTPDAGHLLSIDDGGEGRWWTVASGEARVLGRGLGQSYDIQLSRDGRFVATRDPTLGARVWSVPRAPEQRLTGPVRDVHAVVFAGAGRLLVAGSDEGNLYWWAGASAGVLPGHRGPVRWLAAAAQQALVASASFDATVRLWDLSPCLGPDGAACAPVPMALGQDARAAGPLLFAPAGTLLAVAGSDGVVRLWDTRDVRRGAKLVAQVPGASSGSAAMAWSPSGQTLALGDASGEVRLVTLDGMGVRRLGRGQGQVVSLGFSPDGRQLVAATRVDRGVRLWVLGQGDDADEILLGRHETTPQTLAFSPAGRYLAVAGEDGSLRLWDLAARQSQALAGHAGTIYALAFAPSGRWLASAGQDQAVRLWDVAQGDLAEVLWHPGAVFGLGVAPDGRHLATVGVRGTVRRWPSDGVLSVAPPRNPHEVRAWMGARSTAELNPHEQPFSP